jgi:hypothetical protein
MQPAIQAIKVARGVDGWSWTLVDQTGAPAAAGTSARQNEAMETAWRAARSYSVEPWTAFPEIVVELASTPEAVSPSAH